MELQYALVGFVAAILVGLTGMGGGAIVTPLLLVFGIPPVTAVGTDLAFGAITKAVGTLQHRRSGTVDRGMVVRLAAGSVPGSIIAVVVLHFWRSHNSEAADSLIQRAIAIVLIFVAGFTLIQLIRPFRSQRKSGDERPARPPTAFLVALGVLVGFAVGLTSIGSGTLLMAFLLPIWPAAGITLVGTDIAHGALLTATAATGHAILGEVNYMLLANLLFGSIPGIMLGTVAARHLPNKLLKGVFATMLFTIGLRLL